MYIHVVKCCFEQTEALIVTIVVHCEGMKELVQTGAVRTEQTVQY
jgi:hypothetical protein